MPISRIDLLRCVRAVVATLCLLGLAAPSVHGAGAIPAQVRAVHQLADLETNVAAFCATLVETAEATVAVEDHPTLSKIGAAARNRWLASIRSACEPGRATERHLQAFAVDYDADAARAVTEWFTSERAQHLLALEAAASETDWDAEVSPFIDQIVQEPVDVDRVKLFERIGAALQTTDDAAMLQAGIGEILTWAAQPLLPPGERTAPDQIERELAMLRLQYAQQMRPQQSIIFMFVYRDASNEELAAFATFVESPGARWLNATHRLAMLQLVAEIRDEVVRDLGGV